MADSSATMTTHDVKIEDIGPSRKRITISIPGDQVTQKMDEMLDVMAAQAQLPGFRQGHAPRHIVQKRFGSHVATETRSQLISSSYSEAIQNNKIMVIGEPEPVEDIDALTLERGKPVKFAVEVDVPPTFDMPKTEGVEIMKPLIEVTDDMADKQVKQLCMNEGRLETQDKGAPGDYCIGRGVMKKGDETLLDIEGAVVQIPEKSSDGKGAILGVMVDDFAKQIGTPKAGDVVKFKTKGPKQHEDERVRGADLVIEYEIDRVERIIPIGVEDLVRGLGFSEEKQLREMVTLRLNQRAMLEQQSAMRQQVALYLVDHAEMDLPERVTAKQAQANINRRRMELVYRGVSQGEIERQMAEIRRTSDESAKRDLKLFFILSRAAQDMGVQITPEEVNGRITQMAAQRGMRPDKLAEELHNSGQLNLIAQQIREHKTLDAIVEKAKVEEVSLDDYNKRISKRDELSEVSVVE